VQSGDHPRIFGIGAANPPVRLIQEQTFHAAGYKGERIRKIFLNRRKPNPSYRCGRELL
jgi:hypothetical protein